MISRALKQPRNVLVICISLILLSASIGTFLVSMAIGSTVIGSFFLNLSAGLLGSLLTFVMLDYFERFRERVDARERFKLYNDHVIANAYQYANHLGNRATLLHRMNRMPEVSYDLAKVPHSLENEADRLSMLRYLVSEAEGDITSIKTHIQLSDNMLTNIFSSGDNVFIEASKSMYEVEISRKQAMLSLLEKEREELLEIIALAEKNVQLLELRKKDSLSGDKE